MENQIKNRVFISWSGERSRHVANSLRDWLRLVLHNLDPWMSDRDIGASTDWQRDIRENAEPAVAGIVCLTPENLSSPWLLFEAGALARAIRDPVCTYLCDLQPTDVSPPLSTFQHSMSNVGDTTRLVARLNRLLGPAGLSSTDLAKSLDKWWPDLEDNLKQMPQTDSPSPKREEMELQAETLDIVRGLQRQLNGIERVLRDNIDSLGRHGLSPDGTAKPPEGSLEETLEKVTRSIALARRGGGTE